MEQRQITIISTSGNEITDIHSDAKTWGELQQELQEHNISYVGKKAIVGETKNTFESRNSVLPTNSFELYLMPLRSKSGVSRGDLYSKIKDFIDNDGQEAKDFFNNGRNFTQKSSIELEKLLNEYSENSDNSGDIVSKENEQLDPRKQELLRKAEYLKGDFSDVY